jgi:hypothetical protein
LPKSRPSISQLDADGQNASTVIGTDKPMSRSATPLVAQENVAISLDLRHLPRRYPMSPEFPDSPIVKNQLSNFNGHLTPQRPR